MPNAILQVWLLPRSLSARSLLRPAIVVSSNEHDDHGYSLLERIVPGTDPDVDAVVTAWTTVFDSEVPIEAKARLLQDSATHLTTLEAFADGGEQAGGIVLEPSAVTIDGERAQVTYDVLFAGTGAYGDQTGEVVNLDGTWVVPTAAFCSFMASARTPCP